MIFFGWRYAPLTVATLLLSLSLLRFAHKKMHPSFMASIPQKTSAIKCYLLAKLAKLA